MPEYPVKTHIHLVAAQFTPVSYEDTAARVQRFQAYGRVCSISVAIGNVT